MIQTIPTTYGGVKFRSRLEARWAVFFDHIKLRWFYEYEGYRLDVGWYVPDFWLPTFKSWAGDTGSFIEVKPILPTIEERAKAESLTKMTGSHVFFVVGAPDEDRMDNYDGQSGYFCGEFFPLYRLRGACRLARTTRFWEPSK